MRLPPLVVTSLVAVSLLPAAAEAAAPCDCDHVIELAGQVVSGADMGVQAGQTVCVRGGDRPFLRLRQFTGSADKPIEIRNCEGQVDINNDDKGYGLTVEASRYVRVTGSGDPDFMYGFKVRASKDGPDYSAFGVSVGDLSSDVEIDHMEIYESGFAGVVMKTESRCDGSANLGNFVMYNSKLHHNYIHDTGGEGIYFGSTGYGGRTFTCDGKDVTLYPHEHHGAHIHDNIIEDTAWDGAQIGVTPIDCAFYRNVIKNVGTAGVQYQQQGLQVGGASACAIWGNVLMDGPTNGLFIFGTDDTQIYNNLIVNFTGTGIYINDQGLDLAAKIQVAHNTVIASGDRGIAVFGKLLGPGFLRNNAVAQAGMQLIGIGNEVPDFVDEGNQTADDPATLGFVDAMARDFHLTDTSPLRSGAVAVPELTIDVDLDGTPRDDGTPDIGAFEYSEAPATTGDATTGDATTGDATTDTPPTTGGDTTTTTGSASGSATGGASDSGGDTTSPDGAGSSGDAGSAGSASGTGANTDGGDGCACASGGAPTAAWPMLLVLLGLPRRRGR